MAGNVWAENFIFRVFKFMHVLKFHADKTKRHDQGYEAAITEPVAFHDKPET